MTTNLKVILSAAGIAALLASPAMARTRHYYAPIYNTPIYNAPAPYYGGYYGGGGSYGPYTPSVPTLPYGPSLDFQNGSRG